jgi:glycosyltransferase involved in cell wall biosynthesis
MKVGLIARANQRGTGIQTHEAFRHYPFDRTMVVAIPDMRFPDDLSLYPDATYIGLDTRAHSLPKGKICRWMEGLDVVFSVETLYDWNVADWARDMGIRTVVQGNPEFYVHRRKTDQPHPDLWVWPTSWRPFDDMPEMHILPVPVPNDRPRIAGLPEDDKLVVLHVAGHRALADRNGTDQFIEAIARLRRPCEIRVIGQDGQLPLPSRVPRGVDLVNTPTGVEDRWEMYRGVHVVALPRRYGGNCLPAYEAMASGCAVMMPNISPNQTWPIVPLDFRQGRQLQVQAGFIATWNTVPDAIAYTIGQLDEHRDRLAGHQLEARAWAAANTWRALEHEYDEAFAAAIGART